MSEAKFTPGPWVIQRGNSSNPMVGTDEVSVAEVLDDVHPDTEQQEANARLIAAAPALLAALIELYDATTDGRSEVILAARATARRAMGQAEQQQ